MAVPSINNVQRQIGDTDLHLRLKARNIICVEY